MDRDISKKLKEIYSKAEQKKIAVTPSKAKNMLPYLSKFGVFNSTKIEKVLNSYPKNRSILQPEFLNLLLENNQKSILADSQLSIQSTTISSNYSTKSTWTDSLDKFTDLMQEELKLRLKGHEGKLKKILTKNDTFQAFDKLLEITKIKTTPQQYQSFANNARSILDYNEFISSVNLWFSKTRPEFMRISPVEFLNAETYLLLVMTIARDYMIASSYAKGLKDSNSTISYFTALIGKLLKAVGQGNPISELSLSHKTMRDEIKKVVSIIKMFENEQSYFLSRFYQEAIAFYTAQAKNLTLMRKKSVSSIRNERVPKNDRPRSNYKSGKTPTPSLKGLKNDNQATGNLEDGEIQAYETLKKLIAMLTKYFETDRNQDKTAIEEKIIEKREKLVHIWKESEVSIDLDSEIRHKFAKKSLKSELYHLLKLKTIYKKLKQESSETLKRQLANQINSIAEEWAHPIVKTSEVQKVYKINLLEEFVKEYGTPRKENAQDDDNQMSLRASPILEQKTEVKEGEPQSKMLSTFGHSLETKLIEMNSDSLVGESPYFPGGNENRISPKFNFFFANQDGHLQLSHHKEPSIHVIEEQIQQEDKEDQLLISTPSLGTNSKDCFTFTNPQNQETSFGEISKDNLFSDRSHQPNGNEKSLSDGQVSLQNIEGKDESEDRNSAITLADKIKETYSKEKNKGRLDSAVEENLFSETTDNYHILPKKRKINFNMTSETVFAKSRGLKINATDSDLSISRLTQNSHKNTEYKIEDSEKSSISIQSPVELIRINILSEKDHENEEKQEKSKGKLQIMLVEESKISSNNRRLQQKNSQNLSVQLIESFNIQNPSPRPNYKTLTTKQLKSDRFRTTMHENYASNFSTVRELNKKTDNLKIDGLNTVLSIENLNDIQIANKHRDELSPNTSTVPTDNSLAKKNPSFSTERTKVLYSVEDISSLENIPKSNLSGAKTTKFSIPNFRQLLKEAPSDLSNKKLTTEPQEPEEVNSRKVSKSENPPPKPKFPEINDKISLSNGVHISLNNKHPKSSWKNSNKSNAASRLIIDSSKPQLNTKIKDLVSIPKTIYQEKTKKAGNTDQAEKPVFHRFNTLNLESKVQRNPKDFIDLLFESHFKSNIDLGAFLQFCSDIGVTKNKFRKNTKELSNKLLLSLFDSHSNLQGEMNAEMLRLALKRLAESYYDVEYDLIHSAKISKLPASSKLEMLCEEIKRTIHPFKGAIHLFEEINK